VEGESQFKNTMFNNYCICLRKLFKLAFQLNVKVFGTERAKYVKNGEKDHSPHIEILPLSTFVLIHVAGFTELSGY
jgi:hypothetical protein